ncbi:uncharacterized protein LOC105687479 [Athalia rosae]|uniref:uncharacterized protein LOC105687479 n=1 Tax=Athalia rosae TaxID=37344 RepID=UPI0020343AA1|nr:uncharacterized protein LOC105687479 [Athalia rosae]
MPLDLYYVPGSAPCRAVRTTAGALGVELNLKLLDLHNGEHLKPEFLKINPVHTVPTLDDNGFHLWESRAIMGYLVDKYGKDDSLNPKDPQARALVNQRLYFDMGTLYTSFAEYYYPPIFEGAPVNPEKVKKIEQAFEFLDKFLEADKYAAGKNLTIADHALANTVTTFEFMDYDFSKYKNVQRWYATVKSEIPKYEENSVAGAKAFRQLADRLRQVESQSIDQQTSVVNRPQVVRDSAVYVSRLETFAQLNPQKTIPLLIDGEYKIWESKAIMIYLVNKYGQSAERLYPKNPAARAVVNQRLYFDTIYLDKRIREYYFPSAFMGESIMDPVKYENLCFGFELLNKYLENQNYVCGRILTLADLSIVTSVSTAEVFDFDLAKYKNVTEWYERVKSSAPGYKLANAEGAEMMKQLLENLKSQKSDEHITASEPYFRNMLHRLLFLSIFEAILPCISAHFFRIKARRNAELSLQSSSSSSKRIKATFKMTIDLYYTPESASVRVVRVVAAALGVHLNLKHINLTTGEHLKPEFLRMNITHKVPTIDDHGFYLSESRAIIMYLADKYGKDDKYYPKDIKMRAIVNQRMMFDFGTLYANLVNYYYPVIYEGQTFNPMGMTKIHQSFEFLDKFLLNQEFLAGPMVTLADFTTAVTVSTYDHLGYDFAKFKNVVRWYNHIKNIAPKWKETNEDGAKMFAEIAAPFLRKQ